MQLYLAQKGVGYLLLNFALYLSNAVFKWFSAYFASVEKDDEIQRAVSRESINRQAERLLANHGNAVLRMAYSYLHNMEDAEEILQDTLVQFLKAAPTLETCEHEKAWFLHVAANLCRNRLKYNTIRQTDELADDLEAEGRSELLFVWDAVKSLPEKYREVVHLYYYEGYQTAEIARMLEMKESTVRSNLARGREKLKSVLKEAYDFG
ncbi:MAG: RNA polymerase sigma factor [Candidatus Heteroscillospira sp.]|jgi:RNA polymerase sigma factor (sigma-70 family)